MRFASVVVALSLLGPQLADAKCARGGLKPTVLNKDVLAPRDGGVLVATQSASWDEEDEGDATQPAWQFKIRGKLVAPTVEQLAPGLAVYKLPGTAVGGELTDGKKTLGKLRTKGVEAALPTPQLKAVQHYTAMGRFATGRTTIVLDGATPTQAVAVVITDDKGKAMSYGLAGDSLVAYYHGHCTVLPNGTVEPQVGEKARVFFVDQYGRKSPLSNVVTIVADATK